MTADECHQRASRCAAQAELAVDDAVRLDFLRMAAQWRAIAVRTILLRFGDGPADAQQVLGPPVNVKPLG